MSEAQVGWDTPPTVHTNEASIVRYEASLRASIVCRCIGRVGVGVAGSDLFLLTQSIQVDWNDQTIMSSVQSMTTSPAFKVVRAIVQDSQR